jgi:hypothetical protein
MSQFGFVCLFILVVLGFEVSVRQALYHLSHSASPSLLWVFLREGLAKYFPRLASNCNPPDLCLQGS